MLRQSTEQVIYTVFRHKQYRNYMSVSSFIHVAGFEVKLAAKRFFLGVFDTRPEENDMDRS